MLNSQRGVTLVELMVASAIGLIALSSLLVVYQATATSTLRQLETEQLYSTLQGVLALMRSDIRRAGYWAWRPGRDRLRNNPFQKKANRLRVGAADRETANSCVLFSYDLDRDGRTGTGKCPQTGCSSGSDTDNVEQFGFRLRKNQIQMRYAGSTFNCRNGYWQAITDPGTVVSEFSVEIEAHCINLSDSRHGCHRGVDRQMVRTVHLSVAAHRQAKPSIQVRLQHDIEVRNDLFLAAGEP